MKALFALLILGFSFSSLAYMSEVECEGVTRAGDRMIVEVERSFGGSLRSARSIVYGERGTNPVETLYRVYQIRKFGPYQLQYLGDVGFRLEVDLFPDQAPRWNWLYRARLGQETLNCRFPYAR
jgi:hypothetical protein